MIDLWPRGPDARQIHLSRNRGRPYGGDVPVTDSIHADPLNVADIQRVAQWSAPVITLVAPIDRHGIRQPAGSARLSALISRAHRILDAAQIAGVPLDRATRTALIDGLEELHRSEAIWHHHQGSVLITISPDDCYAGWTNADVDEGVDLRMLPHLRLLLSSVEPHPAYNVLDLALHRVRLRGTHAGALVDLPLGDTPTSIDDALRYEDHERQLTNHTAGTGSGHDMRFHGHGVGDEVDAERVDRFIRAVDRGITESLRHQGRDHLPLIVRSVAEHLPVLRSISSLPVVSDPELLGSPADHDDIVDLANRTRRVVLNSTPMPGGDAVERFLQRRGTGTTAEGASECVAASRIGAIDTLFIERRTTLTPRSTLADSSEIATDEIDDAIHQTWLHGGDVFVIDEDSLGEMVECAALLRY